MKKVKREMEVGKRYRGYGYRNEFGEFCFEPENTGSRAGIIKQIATRDGVSLSHSKENLMIHIKLPKRSSMCEYLREVTRVCDVIINMIKEYDV